MVNGIQSWLQNINLFPENKRPDEGPSSGPSWIAPRADPLQSSSTPKALFSYVDPELKGLFLNHQ